MACAQASFNPIAAPQLSCRVVVASGGIAHRTLLTLEQELIHRYENLHLKHETYVTQHKNERESSQQVIQRAYAAESNIAHLQNLLNRDPFVLALIDGDGMIVGRRPAHHRVVLCCLLTAAQFESKYLSAGEQGGKLAANELDLAIRQWAATNVVDCSANVSVVVRVYANLKGLADVCVEAGLAYPGQIEEFARGFTRGKVFFDFVDVGSGEDRADEKVAGERRPFDAHGGVADSAQKRSSSSFTTTTAGRSCLAARPTMHMLGYSRNIRIVRR